MKLVFAIAFLIAVPFEALTQCKDFSIKVKDSYGYPLKNCAVTVQYISQGSIETKQTNNDGYVLFNCQLAKPNSKPSIKFSITSIGYATYTGNEIWSNVLSREITLSDSSNYKAVRGKIAGKKAAVRSVINEVDKEIEIEKKKEKKSSNQTKNGEDENLIAEYERVKTELQAKERQYAELLSQSSTHHQSAEEYQARYEEKNRDYDELRKKFQELREKFIKIEDAVSIELADCHCLEWSDDYLKVSLRVKDGRKNIVLTSTAELAVDVTKEGKNSSEPVILSFGNPEEDKMFYFSFRPNDNGVAEILIKPRKGEFERAFGLLANPYNYRITFYNRALFPYRTKYKISLGTFLIKDIKENCGAKKPKLSQGA